MRDAIVYMQRSQSYLWPGVSGAARKVTRMETIILIIYCFIVIALVGVVLMQRY